MYLFLSSGDFKNVFPHNLPYDFTCILSKPVRTDNRHILFAALTEIDWENEENENKEDLYVYCSVLNHDTLINESYLPLLRIVSEPIVISLPYYMKLTPEYFNRIRIYIRLKNGEIPQLKLNNLRCCLHIKSKKEI